VFLLAKRVYYARYECPLILLKVSFIAITVEDMNEKVKALRLLRVLQVAMATH